MSEEKKKKGFWSWLGFGKKEEEKQEIKQESEQPENISPVESEVEKQAVDLEQNVANDEITTSESVEEPAQQIEEIVEAIVEPETVEEIVEAVAEPETVEEIVEAVAEPETVEEIVKAVAEPETVEEIVETIAESEPVEKVVETVAEPETIEEIVEAVAEPEPVEEIVEVVEEPEPVEEIVEVVEEPEPVEESAPDQYQEKPSEGGFFSRLIKGLIKTKQNIGSGFRSLFSGKKIDDELFEELEEQLLIADLGMPTTTKIINNLTQHATKKQLKDAELLYQQLKVELADVLKPVAQPLVIEEKKPYVILMVGVNGVGKTTTIGKLARKFQAEGKSVMLAAGDTFRAAAVEQLEVWGQRNNIPVVAQSTGSDSASVIFDAMQSAAAKGIDVLIADTAGRLQNKNNLMDELKKIVRVMKKYDETAPHEIMLTLDAGTGQNAISQAKLFNEAVGLTGITLTKLDGTAKGGVIFAIADQFNIPIRYIGVGEKIEDLRPFDADEFIEALFTHEDEK
ncbi:signal recognition particle-docking protein FtsY [Pasteurellaceae bacterium 15-036681]|nr:signal recognition particle-docking protein FtsY [Pasteurellaceae bacterium 15-036681]